MGDAPNARRASRPLYVDGQAIRGERRAVVFREVVRPLSQRACPEERPPALDRQRRGVSEAREPAYARSVGDVCRVGGPEDHPSAGEVEMATSTACLLYTSPSP